MTTRINQSLRPGSSETKPNRSSDLMNRSSEETFWLPRLPLVELFGAIVEFVSHRPLPVDHLFA